MRPIKLKIALFSNGDSLPLSSHGRAERKRKKFVSRVLTIAVALFMLTLLVAIGHLLSKRQNPY